MKFLRSFKAIGNFEKLLFGAGFQVKLVPESKSIIYNETLGTDLRLILFFFFKVLFALVVSMAVSGSVHRVCVTTCLLFSLLALYYMNKISQTLYGVTVTAAVQQKKKK